MPRQQQSGLALEPVAKAPNPFAAPMDIRTTLTQSPPQLDHVLPGLLRGTVGLLAAAGGTGKTTFMLQLAVAHATGRDLCGGLFNDMPAACARTRKPGLVDLVVAEETTPIMQNRLHAVVNHLLETAQPSLDDAELDALLDLLATNLRIHALGGQAATALLDHKAARTKAFDHLVRTCEGSDLILLDPLRPLHKGDENDSGYMSELVQALQHMSVRCGSATIAAHHMNKLASVQGGEAAGASRGSGALSDGARWQVNLSRLASDLAKAHGIQPALEAHYLRLDLSKANYLAPYPMQIMHRGPGGVLELHRTAGPVRQSRRPARFKHAALNSGAL